ncbi:YkuS family protein [Evansella sp. AB-P1]|uniref:YkuS family protein n=1 Tax=Evansella sp. AB-P1 TaxID=3037653 RepID=UPI00241F2058|nr:YkuS family protein [Evansella sp. AB-P1]MDG5789499.1 YkuS family protein [Evansella sp. AB-P1]
MAKIGVEQSLTDVQQALQERGHEVVSLQQEQDAAGCDCCVITGQDENMMGMQDTSTEGSVINAHGMTAEEICQQVDSKVNQSS